MAHRRTRVVPVSCATRPGLPLKVCATFADGGECEQCRVEAARYTNPLHLCRNWGKGSVVLCGDDRRGRASMLANGTAHRYIDWTIYLNVARYRADDNLCTACVEVVEAEAAADAARG